jgi:hypothetical protein
MTTFNIGSQNAASIQNIGGDSAVEGGLHVSASWQTVELRAALESARKEAAGYGIPAVDRALSAASAEATRPNPDNVRLAGLLNSATHGLRDAGALVDAGTSLRESLRRAASVLGLVGAAVLALL